jgi:large subunit ribosomal protein L24
MVITGADKGQTGRVLRVLTTREKVVVEGINRVWKHVRPSQRHPQGGRIHMDAPIHVSNVMLLDPTDQKGTRIRFEVKDGVKRRIAVGSGSDLGAVGKKK